LPLEHRHPVSLRRANPIGSLSMIRGRKGLAGFVTINFLNFLAFQVLPSIYVLYAAYRYGWGYATVGAALALVGASNIIVQGQLQGINGSLLGLTGVIGPTLFTLIFAFFISSQAPVNLPGAPFLLSALLMISSLILTAKVTRAKDQSSASNEPPNLY